MAIVDQIRKTYMYIKKSKLGTAEASTAAAAADSISTGWRVSIPFHRNATTARNGFSVYLVQHF